MQWGAIIAAGVGAILPAIFITIAVTLLRRSAPRAQARADALATKRAQETVRQFQDAERRSEELIARTLREHGTGPAIQQAQGDVQRRRR